MEIVRKANENARDSMNESKVNHELKVLVRDVILKFPKRYGYGKRVAERLNDKSSAFRHKVSVGQVYSFAAGNFWDDDFAQAVLEEYKDYLKRYQDITQKYKEVLKDS